MKKITANLIAPCGMNCGLCRAYLRDKNPCHGCRKAQENRPKTRLNCKIRNCRQHQDKFCFGCDSFPCDRLKHLDERYRKKYGMSQIANLQEIKKNGLEKFVRSQRRKYQTSKGTFCVHDKKYY